MTIRIVEDASDDTYVLTIHDITLTPSHPRLGHLLRWHMAGRLEETVDLTQVTCTVTIKIGPVRLLHTTHRLPDLLTLMGTTLHGDPRPPAGPWQQTWDLHVPDTVPVARHRIHLRARTTDGKNFLALNIPLDFSHRYHPTTHFNTHPHHDHPRTDRELSQTR
ncbi:hypothetical protein ACF061_39050 [Streptomyces sp. NPDC015220]|uniref:hypothetical protein n=1 Tax=Streptomyces sp. NPDC015220 TaxID=3364947 RepID=UPI0036FBD6DB